MKKLVLFTIAALVCVSAFVFFDDSADADTEAKDDSGFCGENLTYEFEASTGTLTISGSGAMKDYSSIVDIPWFSYMTSVKTVVIGNSVTSIVNEAFCGTSLTTITVDDSNPNYCSKDGVLFSKHKTDLVVYPAGKSGVTYTIPDSVTYIGAYAFADCTSLTSVTIGSSVTYIGWHAFAHCTSLTSVTIPDSVTYINQYAFRECTALTSVTIPDSVTYIGFGTFLGCTALVSVTVDSSNSDLCAVDGVLFDKNKTTLSLYPAGKSDVSYDIPDSVTSIEYYAFSRCTSLKSVTIPDSVISIGGYAFSYCTGLEFIAIPSSVTSIDSDAFIGLSFYNSATDTDPLGITPENLAGYIFKGSNGKLIRQTTFHVIYDLGDGKQSVVLYLEGDTITVPDEPERAGYEFQYWSLDDESEYKFSTMPAEDIVIKAIWKAKQYTITFNTDGGSPAIDPITKDYGSEISAPSVTPSKDGFAFVYWSLDGTSEYKFSTMPAKNLILTAIWADNHCGANATYAFDSATGTLTISGFGRMYGGYNQPWDSYRTSIKKVIIEDSVENIGYYAFHHCTSLTSVTIPDSVTSIDMGVFEGCTSLASVTIPASITYIGSNAFNDCSSLNSIEVDQENTAYSSTNGVLFNKGRTSLIQYPAGNSDTYYSIPDSVTYISSNAFSRCTSLKSVTIPDSVTSIGACAFYNCTSLKSVTIPDSLTTIDIYVFQNCTSLNSLVIPSSVTSIGEGAFSCCPSLTSVTISGSLDFIGNNAFDSVAFFDADDTENKLDVTADNLKESVFKGTDGYLVRQTAWKLIYDFGDDKKNTVLYLKGDAVVVPDDPESEEYTFEYWSVDGKSAYSFPATMPAEDITLTAVWKPILDYTFDEETGTLTITGSVAMRDYSYDTYSEARWYPLKDSIKKVIISGTISSVGSYAFKGYGSLESVVLSDHVESIGEYAFAECSSLGTVEFGSALNYLGEGVFENCTSVKSFSVDENNSEYSSEDGVIFDKDKTVLIQYPAGKTDESYTVPDSVTSVGDMAFAFNMSLKSVDLASVRTLGMAALGMCIALESVKMDSVESIGDMAFAYCIALKSVTIGKSVNYIGDAPFSYCAALETILVDAENAKYSSEDGALFDKDKTILIQYPVGRGSDTYTVPDSVKSIGVEAFMGSETLVSLDTGSVESIKNNAFSECTSLTTVEFGDSLKTIGEYAFSGCTSLTSVIIPDSVTTVYVAFDGCTSITYVEFGKSVTELESCSFSDIKFYDIDGETLLPVNPDNMAGYSFRGTDGKLVKQEYTIMFDSDGGSSVDSIREAKDASITEPGSPTKGGHIFKYWTQDGNTEYDFPETMPAEDIQLKAVWEIIQYTVTFVVDGKTVSEVKYDYGSAIGDIKVPEDPSKDADDKYTYIFVCWDGLNDGFILTENTVFEPVFVSKGISDSAYTVDSENDTVGVPASVLDKIKESAVADENTVFNINAGGSSVSFDSAAIKNLRSSDAELGIVALDGAEKENLKGLVGDGPVYNISFGSNTNFGEGTATVKIPYTLATGCDPTCLKVWYINGSSYTEMPCTYADGYVTFVTNHFSLYAVKNIGYDFDSETGTLTIYGSGAMKDYSSNDAPWYSFRGDIKTVIITDSVTTIGKEAFFNCNSLASVTIPDSVISIGDGAFQNCTSLTSVTIPASVTSIGYCAFRYCTALTTLVLNEGLTLIDGDAFEHCSSLVSVTIPASATLDGPCFRCCTALTSLTISEGVEEIPSGVFSYCDSLISVTIPHSVKYIGGRAFYFCSSLTSVTFADGLISIGYEAFCGCSSLKNVVLPSSLSRLNSCSFSECDSLISVKIPASVEKLYDSTFSKCSSLVKIDVSGGNKDYCSVDGVLFNKDKTTLIQYPASKFGSSFTVPSSVVRIGGYAFYGCNILTTLFIPSSVMYLGSKAVHCCSSLAEIDVAEENEEYASLDGVLFSKDMKTLIHYPAKKSDTSYEIPVGVTEIGQRAFYGCTSLTSITIPDSVGSFGEESFYGCTSLTSVTLPTSVGFYSYDDVFFGCTSLTEIVSTSESNKYVSVNGVLFNSSMTELVQYPAKKSDTSYEIPAGVTRVHDGAFYGCTSLISITIPDSVGYIGDYAFCGCTSLTSITLPSAVNVGCNVFFGCTSLTEILVKGGNNGSFCSENGVLYNADKTMLYAYPAGKTDAVYEMPSTLTSFDSNAVFAYCSNIKEIRLSDSFSSEDIVVLGFCPSLKRVIISDDRADLKAGEGAIFSKDGKILLLCLPGTAGEYSVPEGTVTIARLAFAFCSKLTSVVIPDSVTTISDRVLVGQGKITAEYPLVGCSSLGRITFGNGLQSLSGTAFYDVSFLSDGCVLDVTAENLKGKTFYVCNGTLCTGFGSDIPAEGHALTPVNETPKTCTKDGEKEHQHCSICGKNFIDGKEASAEELKIPAGHDTTDIPGVEPTCTETGLSVGKRCSVCGEVIVEQEVLPMKDHGYVSHEATDAACETAGNHAYYTCENCDKVFDSEKNETTMDEVTVAAPGHSPETVPGKAATCTESGLKDGSRCSVCGKTLLEQETIAATGHKEEVIPATETLTSGKKCSVCGLILEAPESVKDHTEHYSSETEKVGDDTVKTDLEKDKNSNKAKEAVVKINSSGTSVSDESVTKAVEQLNATVEKYASEGSEKKTVTISTSSAEKKTEVSISKESLQTIKNAGAETEIKGNMGTLKISQAAAATLISKGSTVNLSAGTADKSVLTEEQSQTVGDAALFKLSATADGKTVSKFNGKITVTLPYTLSEGKAAEDVAVYYINDNGDLASAGNCTYSDGYVTFETEHFSFWVITDTRIAEDEGISDEVVFGIVIATVILVFCVIAVVRMRSRSN